MCGNSELRRRLMAGHAEYLILREDEDNPKPLVIPFVIGDKRYEIIIKEADDE